jgi:hypothetical protein
MNVIMKKKAFLLAFGVLICVAYSGISWPMTETITIKCRYMAYACGDCHPQYRVEKILGPRSSYGEILNTDIVVHFVSAEQSRVIDNEVSKCAICFDYFFTGRLKKNLNGTFFQVESYKLVKRKKCCDN